MPIKYMNFGDLMMEFDGWHHTKAEARKDAESSRRQGMNARVIKTDGKWCVYSAPKFTKKEREESERTERRLTAYGR
jgi:hypothetical protein